MPDWQHSFVESITAIGPSTWRKIFSDDYVFLRYEFLHALEASGCTSAASGWEPHHLVIRERDETIAILPLYIKTDSYGEYVFDWAWADAYHRYGLPYYPKLLTAVPFTPATGKRWGFLASVNEAELVQYFVHALKQQVQNLNASSWHCLFPTHDKAEALVNAGNTHVPMLKRIGCQYHWLNDGYQSFDDFLARFNSRKRKNLKKERARVAEQDVTLTRKIGSEITASEWQTFYRYYHYTYLKRSGRQGYLNEAFFKLLAEHLSDSVMMVVAERQGKMIAGSLFFFDHTTLYGRHWGCEEELEFLHFEACYYQGIEFAIERGFRRFDPGAQGEHKIQRGFTPTLTYSDHFIEHPQFRVAIANFLEQEQPQIEAYCEHAKTYLPYKC